MTMNHIDLLAFMIILHRFGGYGYGAYSVGAAHGIFPFSPYGACVIPRRF